MANRIQPHLRWLIADLPYSKWQERAACAQVDLDLWHPESGNSPGAGKAVKICRTVCPVRRQCLVFALTMGETGGIYGGFTARARRSLHGEVWNQAEPEDVALRALFGEEGSCE